jgi:hypothetical protein
MGMGMGLGLNVRLLVDCGLGNLVFSEFFIFRAKSNFWNLLEIFP